MKLKLFLEYVKMLKGMIFFIKLKKKIIKMQSAFKESALSII